jgi:carboxy-terminal processing protease precursor
VELPEGNRLLYNIIRDNWSFDFANRYAATHATIPPAEQFEVTDTIFNEFKAFINPDKFKYDRTTDLIMEQLEKAVKTEGYLDTAVQAQMDTLKNLLRHDLNHDLDLNRKAISQYLAGEIVERYYSERGGIIQALKTDIELDSAAAVLHSPERYRSILAPAKH